jgi:hypothetical protein
MSKEVIDRLLESVTSIGNLTFTGGEPTLGLSAIKYFIKKVIDRHIYVGSFYVVTNGKIQSMALMHALIDLYQVCEDQESCTLTVSRDQFHEGCRTPAYEALRFYQPEGRDKDISWDTIINEGMAEYNGIGKREIHIPKFSVEQDGYGDVRVEEMVYVSANGNVISACDCSYTRIDDESMGNILTEDLKTIVLREVNDEREAA